MFTGYGPAGALADAAFESRGTDVATVPRHTSASAKASEVAKRRITTRTSGLLFATATDLFGVRKIALVLWSLQAAVAACAPYLPRGPPSLAS